MNLVIFSVEVKDGDEVRPLNFARYTDDIEKEWQTILTEISPDVVLVSKPKIYVDDLTDEEYQDALERQRKGINEKYKKGDTKNGKGLK